MSRGKLRAPSAGCSTIRLLLHPLQPTHGRRSAIVFLCPTWLPAPSRSMKGSCDDRGFIGLSGGSAGRQFPQRVYLPSATRSVGGTAAFLLPLLREDRCLVRQHSGPELFVAAWALPVLQAANPAAVSTGRDRDSGGVLPRGGDAWLDAGRVGILRLQRDRHYSDRDGSGRAYSARRIHFGWNGFGAGVLSVCAAARRGGRSASTRRRGRALEIGGRIRVRRSGCQRVHLAGRRAI